MTSNIIFSDYIIEIDKYEETTIINASLAYKGLEKFGKSALGLLGVIIVWYLPITISHYLIVNIIINIIAKTIGMILAFIVMNILFYKYFTQTILEIDNCKGTIKSPLDNLYANFTDLQDLSIVDEVLQEGDEGQTVYRLKFLLQDGEKIPPFAFNSYNKIHEIAGIAKHCLTAQPEDFSNLTEYKKGFYGWIQFFTTPRMPGSNNVIKEWYLNIYLLPTIAGLIAASLLAGGLLGSLSITSESVLSDLGIIVALLVYFIILKLRDEKNKKEERK